MEEPDSQSDHRASLDRYSRQMRFSPIGEKGQASISKGAALVVGCGALGSVIAETLVRAGTGLVRIVDRDFVELHNLQRQVMYTEADVEAALPKAIAAAQHLRKINSLVRIEPVIADVDHRNIESLVRGIDVIVDGSDNFEIRFLVNDIALRHGIPWIYGGCLGAEGQTMSILPGETGCLRCLLSEGPPAPGTTPGCDMAGIVAPVVNVIASIEAMEAIKVLSGNRQAVNRGLVVVDLWRNRLRQLVPGDSPDPGGCPACGGNYEWLSGLHAAQASVLCGRNSVQIRGTPGTELDLLGLAKRWGGEGRVSVNDYLIKLDLGEHQLTVFRDARAIIVGTDDIGKARSLYARWIGN
jgi:molybdopterin-synthase adenylyltransferase